MKLLFDANLSPKLVGRLRDLFPASAHVFDVALERDEADETIWEYALANGFTIVTADSDFLRISKARGEPPKAVQLQRCDYPTAQVEDLLRRNAILIVEFEQSSRTTLVIRNNFYI